MEFADPDCGTTKAARSLPSTNGSRSRTMQLLNIPTSEGFQPIPLLPRLDGPAVDVPVNACRAIAKRLLLVREVDGLMRQLLHLRSCDL